MPSLKASVCEEKCCPADLLNRQGFVQQIIRVAKTLSANEKNACYAVNGEWGVGKTFVLNEFEKQISEIGQETSLLKKYIVFHYNCWEYDYYEEPLIALVAVILDQIDTQVNLIPEGKREKIKAALKIVGHSLWKKAKGIVEDKTGIPVDEITQFLSDTSKDAKEQIDASHKFDTYFEFKKTLEALKKVISELTEVQTILLVVDELDRCLPEYTIKVLERLHHIFEGVPNVQVILAVDKRQLENTVKQLYGEHTSVSQYLSKFIDFELTLTVGYTTNFIMDAFPAYYGQFNETPEVAQKAATVCSLLLDGIDTRTRKAIINKAYLCHALLAPVNSKYELGTLCLEIFLVLLKECGLNIDKAKTNFSFPDIFGAHNVVLRQTIFNSASPAISGLFSFANLFTNYKGRYKYFDVQNGQTYILCRNIEGILLATYRLLLQFEDDEYVYSGVRQLMGLNIVIDEYIKNYWDFLQIIN